MTNAFFIALYKACTCSHRNNNHLSLTYLIPRSKAIGYKFFCLVGRKTIDGRIDIGSTNTRYHYMLYIFKTYFVVVQIFTECTIKRCYRVGSLNSDRRNDNTILIYTYNLCSTNAYIYTNYHIMFLVFSVNIKNYSK